MADGRCIDSTWHRSRSTRCMLPAGHTGPHQHEVIHDSEPTTSGHIVVHDDAGVTFDIGLPVAAIPYPGLIRANEWAHTPPPGRRRRFKLWREDVALRWRTRTALWVAPWLYDGDDD